MLFYVRLFATPWLRKSATSNNYQAPLSEGFSRQVYWGRLGCHALLQGIFPTQGLNLGLRHCRQTV